MCTHTYVVSMLYTYIICTGILEVVMHYTIINGTKFTSYITGYIYKKSNIVTTPPNPSETFT